MPLFKSKPAPPEPQLSPAEKALQSIAAMALEAYPFAHEVKAIHQHCQDRHWSIWVETLQALMQLVGNLPQPLSSISWTFFRRQIRQALSGTKRQQNYRDWFNRIDDYNAQYHHEEWATVAAIAGLGIGLDEIEDAAVMPPYGGYARHDIVSEGMLTQLGERYKVEWSPPQQHRPGMLAVMTLMPPLRPILTDTMARTLFEFWIDPADPCHAFGDLYQNIIGTGFAVTFFSMIRSITHQKRVGLNQFPGMMWVHGGDLVVALNALSRCQFETTGNCIGELTPEQVVERLRRERVFDLREGLLTKHRDNGDVVVDVVMIPTQRIWRDVACPRAHQVEGLTIEAKG